MVDRIPSRQVPGRDVFADGHKKAGGRHKGVPNKTTRILKEAVLLAAEASGEDGKGKGGLLGYLKRIAAREPKSFVTLLAKILPLQIAGDADRPVVLTLDPKTLAALAQEKPEALAVLREVVASLGLGGMTSGSASSGEKADPARYAATLRPDTSTAGRA